MIVSRNTSKQGQVKVEVQAGWSAFEVSRDNGRVEAELIPVFDLDLVPSDGRLFRLASKDED